MIGRRSVWDPGEHACADARALFGPWGLGGFDFDKFAFDSASTWRDRRPRDDRSKRVVALRGGHVTVVTYKLACALWGCGVFQA